MDSKDVIIVGAGFAGLSSAALLAKKGFNVTVIEKNNTPGGRAMVYKQDGYKFDMGPSWYMMLEAFERFFANFGKTPDDFYKKVKLNPFYRVFFSDNEIVDILSDLDENFKVFEKLESNGAEKLRQFLKKSKQQYDIAIDKLLYKEYDSLAKMVNKDIIKNIGKLSIFKNFDSYAKGFFSNEKSLQLVEFIIAFVGGAPRFTPAVYSMLSHADLELGQYYPVGGMDAIATAIHKLADENGAEFIFSEEVKKINVDNHMATGVTTEAEKYEADVILATADYAHVEIDLLTRENRTYSKEYWKKRALAPSGFRIFLGLNKKIDAITHHTLFLNEDWDAYFGQLYGANRQWPDDPSYYICCPSKTDASVSPTGGETLSILVLIAPGLMDTPQIREKYYDKIMTHFEHLVGEPVRDSIDVRKIFSVNDYKGYYNAYMGTALGMAHTLKQTAGFRPHRQSKKIDNLYFAGHYTHPGIGVPVTIISGQLASEKIIQNHC